MRLLNVNTRQLEEFFGDAVPPYAILSHTWGKEEVSLQDLSKEGHQQKQGYAKIEGCCQQAIKDEFVWVWVDTCCIDKTSSAELSEAINSMYRWYENSEVCYAYLQDVPSGSDIYEQNSAFRQSRWFTRGWTLQELLAPRRMKFYYSNWTMIFSPHPGGYHHVHGTELVTLLSDITSIDDLCLDHLYPVQSLSAAQVCSWMARRSTTRVEDEAYCLLGLLDINMPLLYGEGNKAFIRLQEAVLSSSDDTTLLAWGYDCFYTRHTAYLATSPTAFLRFPGMAREYQRIPKTHTTVTGHGLHIELRMILIDERSKVWLGIVAEEHWRLPAIAIVLQQLRGGNIFTRVSSCPPVPIWTTDISRGTAWTIRSKQIYISHDSNYRLDTKSIATSTTLERLLSSVQSRPLTNSFEYEVEITSVSETGYSFSSSWPPLCEYWDSKNSHFVKFRPQSKVFYMIFSHEKRDRLAIRTEIEWGRNRAKVAKTAFCVLTGQHTHTALEHCCGAKMGSEVSQFAKDMHWRPYFTAKNVTTNEIGHVYARERLWYRGGNPDRSILIWKKGLCSKDGSATVAHLRKTPESTEQ